MSDAGMHPPQNRRFLWLMIALVALLVGYPHFGDTPRGTAIGGIVAVTLLTAAVFSVRAHHTLFMISAVLAIVAGGADIVALVAGARGHPLVEGSFAVFYAFATGCVFFEVIRARAVSRDTIYGIISVYLLLGVTFGTVYDLLESIVPGSFHADAAGVHLGFRSLIFFSFMTLTTVGYGDITPATHVAQSLAILEGSTGVLFVAVLVARVVGIYLRR